MLLMQVSEANSELIQAHKMKMFGENSQSLF